MTEADEIVESLLEYDDDESVKDVLGSLGPGGFAISTELLPEAKGDDETIKDILGVDYLEPPEEETPLEGDVEVFDRWKNVRIGNTQYCISYLTPVAVHSNQGTFITAKEWSNSTRRHIVKWMSEIGLGGYTRWGEVANRFERISQEELIEMFKRDAKRVQWTKRQAAKVERLPPLSTGLKSDREDRIELEPYRKPPVREAEEEEDVKELVEPGEDVIAGPATVKRHGRMKIVDMPRYTFLISYLTPVAYHDKVFNTYYETTKQWSPTTNQHISAWAHMIWKSSEWKNNPRNWKPSDWTPGEKILSMPRFRRKTQERISGLFRSLMHTMEMKPHTKRRLYHVDPKMRKGTGWKASWLSGHLKHHDTGHEGLPKPYDRDFRDFFSDFDPDNPEYFSWGSGLRDTEPYERYEPDEQ